MENRQGGEKPRVIYNRDIPKLERVNVIMKEVCRLEERMAWQKDRAYNVTRRLTGMPTAHGGESGLDATLAALSALTEDYGEKVRSYKHFLCQHLFFLPISRCLCGCTYPEAPQAAWRQARLRHR